MKILHGVILLLYSILFYTRIINGTRFMWSCTVWLKNLTTFIVLGQSHQRERIDRKNGSLQREGARQTYITTYLSSYTHPVMQSLYNNNNNIMCGVSNNGRRKESRETRKVIRKKGKLFNYYISYYYYCRPHSRFVFVDRQQACASRYTSHGMQQNATDP